jgi:hypothetical protein
MEPSKPPWPPQKPQKYPPVLKTLLLEHGEAFEHHSSQLSHGLCDAIFTRIPGASRVRLKPRAQNIL